MRLPYGYLATFGSRLQQLRSHEGVHKIDEFLRTPQYIVSLSLLTVISNLLGQDMVLYTLFIIIGMFICLFGSDLLGLMPIVILCYIAPSPENNPGSASNKGSIFYPENGGGYLLALLAVFLLCLVFRLVTDPKLGGKRFLQAERCLTVGMLVLGGSYLLSGLGMEGYLALVKRNVLFALAQGAAIFVMYFLFTGGVDWKNVRKDTLAWIGMCVGFVVLPQLLENYLSGRIFMEGTDTIDRELIYAGWGMHNNMGGLMAMMLPFPFYLAYVKKNGWVYNILATILMLGVILSCSRTSIMVSAMVFFGGAVLLLHKKEDRKQNIGIYLFALVGGIAFAILFFDKLLDIFDLFFEELFIISQRDNLFVYGLKQFLSDPMFGGSFFPQGEYIPWDWSTAAAFSALFPPRWHNTLVQIAASCGVLGLMAYSLHRIDTIRLFLRKRSVENLAIAVYIGILLTCSMLDCHFFNIGPVLFYSMALAFAEKIDQSAL